MIRKTSTALCGLISGLLLLVVGTTNSSGATVRLGPGDLGLGSYDSNLDGFGTILTGFDLGTLDPSLAGVTLDVTTTNVGVSGQVSGAFGSRWFIGADAASITYSFNSAVPFAWTTNDSGDPFGIGQRSLTSGEIDTFSGSSGGTLTALNPVPFDAGLTVGASSVANLNATGDINQGYSYVVNAATSSTWTHDDTIGAFNGHTLAPWIAPIPEPSRALLSLVGIAAIGLRRRRS